MAGRRRISLLAFVVIGLTAAALLVVVLAPKADPNPDGLSKVAADAGIDSSELPHAMEDSPLAGYGVEGVDDDPLSTVLAGLIGVAATFVLCAGVVGLVRRRRDPSAPPAEPLVPAA
jgi:cobalt/nickel transport system permease protein